MSSHSSMKRLATDVLNVLKKEYPQVNCTLSFHTPFQLLIATILSAQCTDKRVNLVAPALFERFATPWDFAAAPLEEIEDAIRSTGFYHNKAKNIFALCCQLAQRYQAIQDCYRGEVPETLEELIQLPGVGRKTANVVLGNVFHKTEGFVVDTHVARLSQRIGLSHEKTPAKIEKDLMAIFPQEEWTDTSHRLILLGRGPCLARKSHCEQCVLNSLCEKNL